MIINTAKSIKTWGFNDHFEVIEGAVSAKRHDQLKGSALQSPDDTEATYRKKGRDQAKGYVANISETCVDENEVNLITQVSVEANVTDDQELLKQDVENIVGRMELDELWTDAGYEGEKARDAAEEHAADHKLTAIKGKKGDRLTLDNFQIQEDEEGLFVSVDVLMDSVLR